MTQFWVGNLQAFFHMRLISSVLQFSFFNNFSGQIAYESWTLSLYNVVFTLLPPLVIGIFDQFVSARILDRYPQLYMLGQRNAFFTRTQFWLWVGNALYHSIVGSCPSQIMLTLTSSSQVLFGFSVILFWGDLKQATGLDSGHWFWGLTLYLAVLLTVLGKAALVSECAALVFTITGCCLILFHLAFGPNTLWLVSRRACGYVAPSLIIVHIAIPGSFVFTMAFLPIYGVVAPAIGFSTEYRGIVPRLWTDAVFYFVLILVPIICLTRDFVWK